MKRGIRKSSLMKQIVTYAAVISLSMQSFATVQAEEVELPQKAERPEYNTKAPVVDNKWEGDLDEYDTEWIGDGTKKSPYLIFTPKEFAGMLLKSNEHKGAYYELMADINLDKQTFYLLIWNVREYYGIFDGNGHSIVEFENNRSLFGDIQENASVSNVTVYGKCKNTAVFCDTLYGKIENCISYVDCEGIAGGMIDTIAGNAKVENCYNFGELIIDFSQRDSDDGFPSVGGIVSHISTGSTNSSISNCANFGDISVMNSAYAVGGIVGSGVDRSYSKTMNVTMKNCVNWGDIDAPFSRCTGGVIGYVQFYHGSYYGSGSSLSNEHYYWSDNKTMSISNCANYGDLTGAQKITGGIAATNGIKVTIDKCLNRGLIDPANSGNSGILGQYVNYDSQYGTVTHSYSIANLETVNDTIDTFGISYDAQNCYYVGNATNTGSKANCYQWNTYEEGAIDNLNMEGRAFEVNELSNLINGFPVLQWETKSYNIDDISQYHGTNSTVSLRWSIIPRATGYEIYRSSAADGEMELIGTTADYYYIDKELEQGSTYFYKVRAYRTENDYTYYGEFSEVLESGTSYDHIPGFMVEEFYEKGYTVDGMKFCWSISEQADGYEIIRTHGDETKTFDLNGNHRETLIDYDVIEKETYTYEIRPYIMVNGNKYYGESSDVLEITIPEYVIGDVDEDKTISLGDAQTVLRAALLLEGLEGNSNLAADYDQDGSVTLSDAQKVLRAALLLPTE